MRATHRISAPRSRPNATSPTPRTKLSRRKKSPRAAPVFRNAARRRPPELETGRQPENGEETEERCPHRRHRKIGGDDARKAFFCPRPHCFQPPQLPPEQEMGCNASREQPDQHHALKRDVAHHFKFLPAKSASHCLKAVKQHEGEAPQAEACGDKQYRASFATLSHSASPPEPRAMSTRTKARPRTPLIAV